MRTIIIAMWFVLASPGAILANEIKDVHLLRLEGDRLSETEAQALEKVVAQHPNDLAARTKLLGYYLRHSESKESGRAQQAHIRWIIQHAPDSEIAGMLDSEAHSLSESEFYVEAKTLWMTQGNAHPQDVAILGNAANFFFLTDQQLAEELLLRAKAADPKNPDWPSHLGHLYSLTMRHAAQDARQQIATKSFQAYEEALANATDDMDRFYTLQKAARAAFEAGELERANTYATELLTSAARFDNDGNGVHYGHLVLGRIALRQGDIKQATSHLLDSGRTRGSPNLNSFGPNMQLAKELLEAGERDAVLEYLTLCKNFWTSGREQLEMWERAIRAGKQPHFGANLVY